MNFIEYARKNLDEIPYSLGRWLSFFPYRYRPGVGKVYRRTKRNMDFVESLSYEGKEKYVFERVKKISVFAYEKVPFYRDLYRENDVDPRKLSRFSDLLSLPVVSKSDLQEVPLSYRSFQPGPKSLVNTGGSSGQPLELYIRPDSVGHEWAHMHAIWARQGFKPSDVRIVFAGRSDVRNVVQYDSFRHQFNVDIYAGWNKVAEHLYQLYTSVCSPKYLHGYPSAIFDFVLWLQHADHPLLALMKKTIEGGFLGSELPSPALRSEFENILSMKSVSWYGHTERAVLAYEKIKNATYYPFLSYGYAEAVSGGNGNRLVATSYYNTASPLIRYDSGDLIEPNINNGIMESFEISEGRQGEYIVDRKGNKIFLTALIFGRHHKVFDYSRNVQVYQARDGMAVFCVTPRVGVDKAIISLDLFNTENMDFDLSVCCLDAPARTLSGKMPLLIKKDDGLKYIGSERDFIRKEDY